MNTLGSGEPMIQPFRTRAVLGGMLTVVLAACGGDGDGPPAPAAGADVAQDAAPAAPVQPTGNVIEVHMATTMGGGSGEYQPVDVTARRGDVLRFVNDGGVAHNVSFPASLNPGAVNLPPPSPYLVEEGATHDILVELAPGEYEFQCDPHVMMGMRGRLIVEG
jgi:plastocyanin